MDENDISETEDENLANFLRKLKEVFDMCDEDADGYIRVEHFLGLGQQFGAGDELQKLTKYLDPKNLGKISFRNFCHGVFAIKGCEELLNDGVCEPSVLLPPYQAEYEDYYYQPSDLGVSGFLPCGGVRMTLAHPECDMDSASEPPPNDEAADLGPLFMPARESEGGLRVAGGSEEQFEDYGEGDEGHNPGSSDLGSSVSSSAGQTPRRTRSVFHNELLDIYCSQCCKKINLLNDLEARLHNLKANSPNRKISSTAFGRQLFHSSNLSSSTGSTEDLFRDSIDSCDNDITEKVSFLERKVTELENDSIMNGDQKSKLKQENIHLVHRVHALEEQLKDQETRAEEHLQEEERRQRDLLTRVEREKSSEIEILSFRAQQLEEENYELKTTATRLRSHSDKLDEERQRMTYKLEDTSLRLKDEMNLYKKMMDKMRQNRLEFQKEREATQELIEDLRKELEHLQLFKLETERPGRGRSVSVGIQEYNWRSRELELEHELKRLKLENVRLREQNEDLNGQILSLSLYEAKNLFATQTRAQSLAAEIDSASRDELMEALKEQEEINFRLRQYMDKIILAILDHNPSILEIKK
ncbi:rab11 family-interacting protein 4A [Callorhinchus milii]|uniref:Rab11 family-interacting protein 4 n=2 Tax=Callorhinchus milii TaxID=7868 RepID=V9KIA1_CALMI|nr:rab11 family-interacting protein 4A [Callorhinchus milii]